MVSIIKNQILKHLSKFTKNLSSDKINLSTFKGEGELSDLQLNEIVLTDLLELPSWLKLTSAFCNKVAFRIQWAKLKSVPILLSLDEVIIEVETCEELRSTSCPQGLSSYAGAAKYTFIHKVIDGMTVMVNTVKIKFTSPAFTSSVEFSRICVESKSPQWEKCELSSTRIKDTARGQVLLFKELEWQNVRIEARSTKDQSLSPLRLLTNKARCRITLKKRTSDSFILGSRLAVILEDLLWVLTDFQLKAALHFLDSIAGLIQRATEFTRKLKAARKLEVLPEYQAQQTQSARSRQTSFSHVSNIFKQLDVVETSYHFLAHQIVFHFSDDAGAARSCHPELKDGGALQMSLKYFKVDFYPYHLAAAGRSHWATYKEDSSVPFSWLQTSQLAFKSALLDLVSEGRASEHTPLSRNHVHTPNSVPGEPTSPGPQPNNMMRGYIQEQFSKLMTSCLILRLKDFNIYQVSATGTKKHIPKDFISVQRKPFKPQGDMDRHNIPDKETVLHAEFTYYYYPGDDPFPLPVPKFYVHVKPIQVNFDVISLLWLNAFALNLHQSLLETAASQDPAVGNLMYFDVKIEAIMPRIIFESTIDHPGQKDRPKSLHLAVSRAHITNVRSVDRSSRADLEKCIDSFQMGSLFFNGDFPSLPSDYHLVSPKFIHHVTGTDEVRGPPSPLNCTSIPELKARLRREMLWTEAKDVWCLHLDPVWGDFYGARAVGKERPVPFLDAFPLTLWVYLKLPEAGGNVTPVPHVEGGDATADVHVLAHVSTLVSVQLNHYQYLFILRLAEEAQELATYLGIDTARIIKKSVGSSLVLGAVLPQLDVTLVMPSQSPGKESSGGDIESVYPDSSSIQDDITTNDQFHFNPGLHSTSHTTNKCKTSASQFSMEYTHDAMYDSVSNKPTHVNGTSRPQPPPSFNFNMNNPEPGQGDTVGFQSMSMGLKSFKKGFDTFMTSLDLTSKNVPDEAFDNMSIRSDASSESETYVQVGNNDCSGGTVERIADALEAMFRIHESAEPQRIVAPSVEMAEEVEEETTLTSPSERDSYTSSCKRRDLVSMVTLKLGKVEFVQQSEGLSSAIKIQVSNLELDECVSIPWDEFLIKFSARSRGWLEVKLDDGVNPRVKLRLTRSLNSGAGITPGPAGHVERSAVLRCFDNTVDLRVQGLNLDLNASSVTGIIDLVEDEVFPVARPAQIWLEEIKLHVTDDRPLCNITSPGSVPVDLNVKQLYITRDEKGLIEVTPQTHAAKKDSSRRSTDRLVLENDELRRRLAALEARCSRCAEENSHLKLKQEDMQSKLNDAQDERESLLKQKGVQLDRIQLLQEQLCQLQQTSKR